MEELVQRSQKTVSGIKERLQILEAAHIAFTKMLQRMEEDRLASTETLRRDLATAQSGQEALAARLTEVEKPRGLRALWAKLFGKKTKTA